MARRVVAAAAVILFAALPAPAARAAAVRPSITVVPSCVQQGAIARIVILGAQWAAGEVDLLRNGELLGTAIARPSPVSQRPGAFSFTADVPATTGFTVTARQGQFNQTVEMGVQSTCPLRVTVQPTCLRAAGQVEVSGFRFPAGGTVQIRVDPFGPAETPLQETKANEAGEFTTAVHVPFTGAQVPVVVTRPAIVGTTFIAEVHAVAFVDPCPPDPTTTTTTRSTPGTTAPKVGPTTTTAGLPPTGGLPPEVPPVRVPTPGATAQVSISPRTVRPGRCAVIVVSAAPSGLPVVARFADGPAVNGQTGPDGGAVLSVCHPHDSGLTIGPVKVLVGIGPGAPVPVFTVLRVPPRPQPPLLQAGADGRRS